MSLYFNILPLDVIPIVLQNTTPAELPTVALVCKYWKEVVDDKKFREMIRPSQTFGTKEWKQYIGVDVDEEPGLPRRAYGDMDRGDYFLTFIPNNVKVNGKNFHLDFGIFRALILAVKEVRILIYGTPLEIDQFREKKSSEISHWILMRKEFIGLNENYETQQELALEENNRILGAHIPGFIDTAVSLILEYVKSNSFTVDLTDKYKIIRVSDWLNGRHITLVNYTKSMHVGKETDNQKENSAPIAWKSYGLS